MTGDPPFLLSVAPRCGIRERGESVVPLWNDALHVSDDNQFLEI